MSSQSDLDLALHDPRTNQARAPADTNDDAATDARRVRRNLLRATMTTISGLSRGRKLIILTDLAFSVAQILAFTPILFLGSSHGGSYTPGEYCNPQPMFIYLLLYVLRLVGTVPCDLYLGLSPHRGSQARRLNEVARARLERERLIGSLRWDARVSKLNRLLTLLQIILFVIGNFVVFSSTECSEPPADSVPLFFACLAALIIGYLCLVLVTVLTILLVCALPFLVWVLRALGMADTIPRPVTGKVEQNEVDKHIPLVYFTPAAEPVTLPPLPAAKGPVRSSLDQLDRTLADVQTKSSGTGHGSLSHADVLAAASVSLPVSRRESFASEATHAKGADVDGAAATSPALDRIPTPTSLPAQRQLPLGMGRLQRLFRPRRAAAAKQTRATQAAKEAVLAEEQRQREQREQRRLADIPPNRRRKLAHPLLEIEAHRATCAICLCDFEEPSLDLDDDEPEPLRHLKCGHVFHKSCVDEWFTTVSARCPVCQRPLPFSQRPTASDEEQDGEAPVAAPTAGRDRPEATGVGGREDAEVGSNTGTRPAEAIPMTTMQQTQSR